MEIPAGFAPVGKKPGDLRHAYFLGDPKDSRGFVFLSIRPMGGLVDPKKTDFAPRSLPAGMIYSAQEFPWQGVNIPGARILFKVEERDELADTVVFPLRTEAIEVKITGPTARRAEFDTLLPQIINSTKGETNWSTDWARFFADSSNIYLLILAIAIVVIGFIALAVVSKYAQTGMVLVVSVVTYVAGNLIAAVITRPTLAIGGALELVGVVGGIVGVVQLVITVRKKSPQPK